MSGLNEKLGKTHVEKNEDEYSICEYLLSL
jgi:hypothetical protein